MMLCESPMVVWGSRGICFVGGIRHIRLTRYNHSMFDTLPRDLQLEIIKHFDMDTRIRYGIIGRLRVPDRVKELIQNRVKPIREYFTGYNHTRYRVDLGKYMLSPNMNIESHIYSLDLNVDGHGIVTWKVIKWRKNSIFCEEAFELEHSDSSIPVYRSTPICS